MKKSKAGSIFGVCFGVSLSLILFWGNFALGIVLMLISYSWYHYKNKEN